MYRQPENSNRVKSMKSKFEGLNVPNSTNNIRFKNTSNRNDNSGKCLQGKTSNDKQINVEKNNNKVQNNKINPIKMKTDDNKSQKEKFLDKNSSSDKNFFDINKKELCNVPPLNLTRQLNDPSKKGCIKRTPAFRKDKITANNRTKTTDDLNFANIVRLFENNDIDTCDNNSKTLTRTLNSDSKIFVNPIKQNLSTSLSNITNQTRNLEELKKINSVEKLKVSNINNSSNDLDIDKEVKNKIPAYAEVNKPKKKVNLEELEIGLTDSLKAALKQPLPTGPPPKKPPRTFTHNVIINPKSGLENNKSQAEIETSNSKSEPEPETSKSNIVINSSFCNQLNENLAQKLSKTKPTKVKSDPKLMLEKLENALLSNKIRSPKLPKKLKTFESPMKSSVISHEAPNHYTSETNHKTIFPNCLPSLNCVSKSSSNAYAKIVPKNATMSTFFAEISPEKSNEPIYAEPFQFKSNNNTESSFLQPNSYDSKTDTLNSLHYMSNPVCEVNHESISSLPLEDVVKSFSSTVKNAEVISREKSAKNVGKDSESAPLTRQQLNLIMNRTYASSTPSDSEMDSSPSTPSSDGTPQCSKKNTIKDLISSFEQKHQLEPLSLKEPVNKQKLNSTLWCSDSINKSESEKPVNESEVTINVEDKKKFKSQLNRTLTEIRKTYVKRVNSTIKRKSEIKKEVSHLFECCLLVELNISELNPYIKNKFPSNYEVPAWIEHLCFPDATEWIPKRSSTSVNSQDCQCYSLVITNEKGDRKFGYCRRVVPEEASICLPLTYCIISSYRATGFYNKVLKELESRHGLPFGLQEAFVQELYNCKFPQPGESIKVSCSLKSMITNNCEKMLKKQTFSDNVEPTDKLVNMQNGVYGSLNKTQNEDNNFRVPKNTYSNLKKCNSNECLNIDNLTLRETSKRNTLDSKLLLSKRVGQLFEDINLSDNELNLSNSLQGLDNCDLNTDRQSPLLQLSNSQLLNDCLLGDVVLKRPYDSRLEDADLTTLFNTLNLTALIQTFGSLLHERKVIFVSNSLSKLSSCIEALHSILYPFSWQHTFIPVLSNNMLDVLSAPFPIIAGVLSYHIKETLIIEEGIAVDLDTSKVVCYMGDENEIIPKRLQKGLTVSLQLVTETTEWDDKTRNVLVSEAFIRLFVEVCGCYRQYIVVSETGQNIFERENFIQHHSSKCVKLFLEWFSETAMFGHFIQSHLDGEATESMFDQRCYELNAEKNSAALLKNSKVTQKMKHFGHKLFH